MVIEKTFFGHFHDRTNSSRSTIIILSSEQQNSTTAVRLWGISTPFIRQSWL